MLPSASTILVPLVALALASSVATSASAQDSGCTDDGWCTVYELPRSPETRRLGRWLHAIWGSDSNNIFAVGRRTIVHFDGSTWTLQDNQADSGIFDVEGTAPNEVYAVGSNRTIQRWNGTEWLLEHRDRRAGLRAGHLDNIFVLPGGEIITTDIAVWRRGNGTWERLSTDPFRYLDELRTRYPELLGPGHAPACRQSGYAVAAGNGVWLAQCPNRRIYLWQAGSWTEIGRLDGPQRSVHSGWYVRPDLIFVGQSAGIIRRYDGSAWHSEATGTRRTQGIGEFWSDGTWLYATALSRIIRRRL